MIAKVQATVIVPVRTTMIAAVVIISINFRIGRKVNSTAHSAPVYLGTKYIISVQK